MANTPSIISTKLSAQVVERSFSGGMNMNQLRSVTLYNFPANGMAATQARVLPVISEEAGMEVTQLRTLVVARGRAEQSSVVAWTFTLDGHDFYALRLGDETTLVYDQNTQQWAEWGEDLPTGSGVTDTNARWTMSTGLNWQGMGALAEVVGTNIVAGDDTFGAVYAFDPAEDEDFKMYSEDFEPFTRIAQGQLVLGGRNSTPVWGVQLGGSIGDTWTGDLVNVELQSSDDSGNTYFSHGIIPVPQGDYNFRLDWTSLGAMTSPGRLFKIIDDGAIVRLDSLDSYDQNGN